MNIDKLLIATILVGFFVFTGATLFNSFADVHSFNQSDIDPRFDEMVNISEINVMIDDATSQAQSTDSNPLFETIDLFFRGGYFAVRSFIALPNILKVIADNTLSLLGVPDSVFVWIEAFIMAIVLFAVLKGIGVFKEQ